MPDLGLSLARNLEAERAAEQARARAAGEIAPPERETSTPDNKLDPDYPYTVRPFDPEVV